MLTGGQLYSHLTDPAMRAMYVALFQTGWFVQSMWSQTLVLHMLRTPRLPLLHSRAAAPVTALTLAGIALVTALPFTPLAPALGLTALPPVFFAYLAGCVLGYMVLITVVKRAYIRRCGALV